jgi:hypothetical protein
VASDYSIGIFNVFPFFFGHFVVKKAKKKGKKIEDTNRVIRSHKNKGEQTTKWPIEKGKTLKIPIE